MCSPPQTTSPATPDCITPDPDPHRIGTGPRLKLPHRGNVAVARGPAQHLSDGAELGILGVLAKGPARALGEHQAWCVRILGKRLSWR